MNLKNREQMDWFSSIEFTPLLCFEQLQGPPNTINNPSPNLPHQHLGPRDIQRLCSSIKASKLNMTTKPQGRKELQLTSTSTTFLQQNLPQTSDIRKKYLPPTSLEFQELEPKEFSISLCGLFNSHRQPPTTKSSSFGQVLGRHLFDLFGSGR